MSRFLIFFLFAAGLFLTLSPFEVSAQKTKKTSKKVITPPKQTANNKSAKTLTAFEKEVLDEINLARQDPKQYAAYLEDIRQYYKGATFTFPNRTPILTIEGTTAIDDAVANLKKAKPSNALTASDLIRQVTSSHLQDMLKTGIFSHKGSDEAMPDERLGRYIDVNSVRFGENIVTSTGAARDVVLRMLIDDGVPSRSHRRNVLDPEFRFIGLSSAENANGGQTSVLIFSTGDTPKK